MPLPHLLLLTSVACACAVVAVIVFGLSYDVSVGPASDDGGQASADVDHRRGEERSSNETSREPLSNFSCNCQSQSTSSSSSLPNPNSKRSPCGASATRRGSDQRIFSYSLYGSPSSDDLKLYMAGLSLNVFAVRTLFPGYGMRIHTDWTWSANDKAMGQMCAVVCQQTDLIDVCNVNAIDGYGNISLAHPLVWRFLPMSDPLVSEWHSRDLDGLMTAREAAAVADWRHNANVSVHVIRDHPFHVEPIMGGLFGMRFDLAHSESVRNRSVETFAKMVNDSSNGDRNKGKDQTLLDAHLCRWAKDDLLAHDSYGCEDRTCRSPSADGVRPFPTRREVEDATDNAAFGRVNFVGNCYTRFPFAIVQVERSHHVTCVVANTSLANVPQNADQWITKIGNGVKIRSMYPDIENILQSKVFPPGINEVSERRSN